MRRICINLLLLALCLCVGGCAVTGEVENQAYALVMGVDTTQDGGLALTIRIPRIGHGGTGDDQSGVSKEPYLTISAEGSDYAQALENLQWAVARELNLSHLKLLIVSEALASQGRFPGLIREIAETRHLYTTAGFIVCEGRAGSFIDGQETLLSNHLADDIDAMFRHYSSHGFIPGSTFADLYYATQSCYSDPTGIWGFPDAGEQPASAIVESDEALLNKQTKTASSRQFLGAALFRDGILAGRLDAAETLCLNLLTRRVDTFSFEAVDTAWALSSTLPPRLTVTFEHDFPRLRADVFLTCSNPSPPVELENAIAQSLERLIERCQRLEVEPFGFAPKAAAHFATLNDWLACNWRTTFSKAAFNVKVHISGPT